MLARNLTLTSTSVETATRCLHRLFQSRKCTLVLSDTDEVYEYSGFVGTSSLTQGYGSITMVSVDNIVEIRIRLQTSPTLSGSLLGVVSLLASIPLIGVPILLYLLLYDHAVRSVTYELDALIGEVYKQLDGISKNG